ncbi:MAG: biotin--[acetyl-CoA-carboxylase] ligase [Lachnospiraceae bacterium]|nr:biotin--[acetyl-CoA-carboxylase] ligase [Candidatus Darwinimomas equi]
MKYDIEKIKKNCPCLNGIRYMDAVDSTNKEARRIAPDGEDNMLVIAERQDGGRGRLGRSWHCAGEDAIAMSILVKPQIDSEKVSMLTIIAALAVSRGIADAAGLDTSVKWPNDIKSDGRKICGILSESVFSGSEFYSVIGIGINVNNDCFPDDISDIAGSVKQCTGKCVNREDIVIEIINRFYEYYEVLCREGDLSSLMDEYNGKCITEGGINKYGELILADGSLKRSGEV